MVRRQLISLCCSCLIAISLGAGFDGIPGDYCRYRNPTCCPNRDDDCTVEIMDTLCYCDVFCDRPDGGDCCPDFFATCRNDPGTPKPAAGCFYKNHKYAAGDRVTQNCNDCQCVADPYNPAESKWSCGPNGVEQPCLIQEDLLEKVESGRFSWTASNYSFFYGLTLINGVKYRLGTLQPQRSVADMNEIQIKVVPDLPESFDVRVGKWAKFIHPVRDQGNCGASWAFSTTSLSADRMAIQSMGLLNATLSPQQLLSCNQHRQNGCEGGYLDRAWWYIRKLGVVSEDCYSYTSGDLNETPPCKLPKAKFLSTSGFLCPSGSANNKVYKMTPPYRIKGKEEEIMTEIMVNGPVQTAFLVREDFFMYSGGVYQHLRLAEGKDPRYSRSEDYHSVRILGWGVDRSTGKDIKYWLCDNSWGTRWGESGYFRILRGENHCNVESFVVGAWGKGSKKRRRFRVRKMKKLRRRL